MFVFINNTSEKDILMNILVSSCLLGIPCRWHGKKLYLSSFIKKYQKNNAHIKIISVCPETLGGLPTPRPPVKRCNGKVFETCPDKTMRKNITGKEITKYFIKGAEKTLAIALKNNIELAILCNWSPSCDKSGITGKLLIANNIKIINTW